MLRLSCRTVILRLCECRGQGTHHQRALLVFFWERVVAAGSFPPERRGFPASPPLHYSLTERDGGTAGIPGGERAGDALSRAIQACRSLTRVSRRYRQARYHQQRQTPGFRSNSARQWCSGAIAAKRPTCGHHACAFGRGPSSWRVANARRHSLARPSDSRAADPSARDTLPATGCSGCGGGA